MKIHRLNDTEIESVRTFSHACESFLETKSFSLREPYQQWEEWDEEDEDKKMVRSIIKRIAAEEDISEKNVDGRMVAYEYLKLRYSSRLWAVVLTADVLIQNVCDPTISHLDFHPSFYQNHVAPEQ